MPTILPHKMAPGRDVRLRPWAVAAGAAGQGAAIRAGPRHSRADAHLYLTRNTGHTQGNPASPLCKVGTELDFSHPVRNVAMVVRSGE